jgi:hypothetical protein
MKRIGMQELSKTVINASISGERYPTANVPIGFVLRMSKENRPCISSKKARKSNTVFRPESLIWVST